MSAKNMRAVRASRPGAGASARLSSLLHAESLRTDRSSGAGVNDNVLASRARAVDDRKPPEERQNMREARPSGLHGTRRSEDKERGGRIRRLAPHLVPLPLPAARCITPRGPAAAPSAFERHCEISLRQKLTTTSTSSRQHHDRATRISGHHEGNSLFRIRYNKPACGVRRIRYHQRRGQTIRGRDSSRAFGDADMLVRFVGTRAEQGPVYEQRQIQCEFA